MKPPYSVTPKMLDFCMDIGRLLGAYEGLNISKPEPQLCKSNRVKTIQASLSIEGNTLSLDQVTAILDGKKVIGSKKEIQEVQNSIMAYNQILQFKTKSSKSLRFAHSLLMKNLIPDAGEWRSSNVGIFQGTQVTHKAPQAKLVPELMENLFLFMKNPDKINALILSAIFHYELEFIHPFSDGNGRAGRLWQTALLTNYHPLFEFTPVESIIKGRQNNYYASLAQSDKQGSSNAFIEFSLETIRDALEQLTKEIKPVQQTAEDRLVYAKEFFVGVSFSRKDYLDIFKTISTATASRDLALGIEKKWLKKIGVQRSTLYTYK